MRRFLFPLAFLLCLVPTWAPLWIAHSLPVVDLPQHLFLIHVLDALGNPASSYHEVYRAHPGLTYLTFYYSVRALSHLFGLQTAMLLWLSLVAAAIPASLAGLLKSLGRSPWLALFAFPLVYTDNFYWGLISFLGSIPLTFTTMACFIVALEAAPGSRRSRGACIGLAVSLVLLQLTHAAAMILPAIALPLLLLTTRSDLPRRLRALAALVPGVALFLLWLFSGVTQGRKLGTSGEHWAAAGSLLDPANLVFTPVSARLHQATELLSNGFWDWADAPPIRWLGGMLAVVLVVGIVQSIRARRFRLPLRALLLFALALACYLFLPTDVRGYMYQLHFRYAQVAALLLLCVLPSPKGAWRPLVVLAAVGLAIGSGTLLTRLFTRFSAEAESFEPIVAAIPPRSMIFHLVADPGSRVASHAVYLHYAALAASRTDSIPSFSLALDPSFPVGYREGRKPPAPPWEWQPDRFDWNEHAKSYDYFLVKDPRPLEQLFGPHASEVELTVQSGPWRLLHRIQ